MPKITNPKSKQVHDMLGPFDYENYGGRPIYNNTPLELPPVAL